MHDSAGVTVVEHGPVAYGELPQWRMGDRPTLDIGRATGEEGDLLHQVRDVIRMRDGSIALINSFEVRRYDGEGRHLWTQGRQGEGPGSYVGPSSLAETRADSLIVWDVRQRRLTVLSGDGVYGRVITPDPPGGISGATGMVGSTGGAEVVLRSCALEPAQSRDGGHVRRYMCSYPALHLDSGTRSLGNRLWYTRYHNELGMYTEGAWPAAGWGVAAPGGLWYGWSGTYEVQYYRAAGLPGRIVRWQGPDRSVPEGVVRAYDGALRENEDEWDAMDRVWMQMEADVPKPDRFPAFDQLLTDQAGRLWLRDYVKDDIEDPDLAPGDDPAVHRWTVFSADGARILARLEHPSGFVLHDAGDGWVLGVEEDELGVEHVRLYPLVALDGRLPPA